MIISFSFKNHHSYQEEQEFSMERPAAFKYQQDSIKSAAIDDDISSVAAIYGANASGKSGFIGALKSLCNMAVGKPNRWKPFRLSDDWASTNSEFSIVFIAKDQLKYQYDLIFNGISVVFESLLVWETQKPSKLFERTYNDGVVIFGFGDKFTSKNIQDVITKETKLANDETLLSFLKKLNESVTKPVYEFFDQSINFCNAEHYGEIFEDIRNRAKTDPSLLSTINQLLPVVDLGISNVGFDKPGAELTQTLIRQGIFSSEDDVINALSTIMFTHGGIDSDAKFEPRDESRGTIAATVFLVLMQDALRNGSILVVDELDSSLHPILVAKLIEVFNSTKTNPYGAQLIFTTHDISLIENYEDGEVLDRDQIWFVEKDAKGRSRIYSLLSIQDPPREGSNIGLKYIHGRYGATPNISLFEKLLQLNQKDPAND